MPKVPITSDKEEVDIAKVSQKPDCKTDYSAKLVA